MAESMFIYRTNYFRKPWTWIKKIGMAVWIPMGILVWSRSLPFGQYFWLACLIGLFLMVGVLLSPVDDLLVDEGNLYLIKTSLVRYFSRIDRYEIYKIKSIRCTGVHEKASPFGNK